MCALHFKFTIPLLAALMAGTCLACDLMSKLRETTPAQLVQTGPVWQVRPADFIPRVVDLKTTVVTKELRGGNVDSRPGAGTRKNDVVVGFRYRETVAEIVPSSWYEDR